MKILIFTFFFFSLIGNIEAQNNKENIKEIRRQFQWINNKSDFNKVVLENEEFTDEIPDEGCGLIGYYEKQMLYKVVVDCISSVNNFITEYYFKDDKLLFVFNKEEKFSGSLETGNQLSSTTTFEERIYYADDTIIRHLKKGASVLDTIIDYQKNVGDILKYVNTKIKFEDQFNLLQGIWKNTEDTNDWFEIRGLIADIYHHKDFPALNRIWYDGRYLWFHNTELPQTDDSKFELLELTDKNLELQNRLSGEVLFYKKIQ